MSGFVTFERLSPAQQAEVLHRRPNETATQAARFEYRLKADGEVSLKLGGRRRIG